jgi:hypothetical protein
MKRKLSVLILVVLTGIAFACGTTFTKQAYRTGSISKSAFEMTLTSLGELYNEGLINEGVKQKAIEYGDLYMNAHNEAIEALAQYKELGLENDKADYLKFASEASILLAKFLNYARPYLLENNKEVP